MTDQEIIRSIDEGLGKTGYLAEIRKELETRSRTIVVLDDDPTGTQTIYDVPVITQWTEEAIEAEIQLSPVFFILTNSRSLLQAEADALGKLIGRRLRRAAHIYGKRLVVISRSDSTLRGHYPGEVNALASGLNWNEAKHLLIPAFFEGGRYTYDDTHYVREGEVFIPTADTPFAKDNTFGYQSSNLKAWIQEKTKGRVTETEVESISVATARQRGVEAVGKQLIGEASHYIVNATAPVDLQAVALAGLRSDAPIIYRTGASFVNAITAIAVRPLLGKAEILPTEALQGGLVIVGSYVPKTTRQLRYLKERSNAYFMEFDVATMLKTSNVEKEIVCISAEFDRRIGQGEDVVLYTSRQVHTGNSKEESLKIVNLVSQLLISIVSNLRTRPKYIIAKGGITSSDVAVKALGVKRALVLGQAIKGVPVWRLDTEAKFTDLPYIVFPGNVGDDGALFELIEKLT